MCSSDLVGLVEIDSSKIRDLRDKMLATTTDLVRARRGLVEAALGDKPLAEARDPKVIVERLVAEMAPVVREIAKRSLAPTELVLKRQTGDGRREEIFVSRRDLQVKLRGLGAAARAVFAPLELGEAPAEDPPTIKVEKPAPKASEKAGPILLTEKKKPAPLFADALAVDKVPADKPAVADKPAADKPAEKLAADKPAEKLAADKPAEKLAADKLAVEKTAEKPPLDKPLAVKTPSAAADKTPVGGLEARAADKSDPLVVLDDSLDRLIVSEETRKP